MCMSGDEDSISVLSQRSDLINETYQLAVPIHIGPELGPDS